MYSPGAAYQSKESTRLMQERRLQEILQYVSRHSAFYQNRFAELSVDVSAIRTIEDLLVLPPTTKEDLQQYNDDFLCVPRSKIVEFSSTSGTLGKPVTVGLTESDLQRLAFNEYLSFLCADGTPGDIYQLMLTLDRQFMAGIAYYSGIRKMGAGIIRIGPGVPSMQWETIQRLKPTAIVAVPSFIVKLIQFAREHKIDINKTSVRKAVCIGENIRNTDFSLNILGRKITEEWNIHLYSTYASTEMQTAFTECGHGRGGHFHPELMIVEVLDDQNQPVKAGEAGEVTITTLGIEGMPLIRYKTGDICMFFDDPCPCGRSGMRLSPVMGRKKQMIKYKGTTLYPPALFELLNEMEEVTDYVVEVYSNDIGMDEVLLHLLPVNSNEETDRKIRAYLQARLRVSPHVKYTTAAELQKMQFPETVRKTVKFIDRR
ncbi:MAG: phenylacetate--CoA ligase family protein [Chitinophagaceae bacterium]|nr:MAG: phenylacetate--CoA ligase family protein [Chitinophagaceae bacterium]